MLEFEVNKPWARGLFHVALKRVSGDATIDFEYVLSVSFKPLLTVES